MFTCMYSYSTRLLQPGDNLCFRLLQCCSNFSIRTHYMYIPFLFLTHDSVIKSLMATKGPDFTTKITRKSELTAEMLLR